MAKKIYLSPANHDGENVCKFKPTCRETIHCRTIALYAQKYLQYNGFLVKVRKTMQGSMILSDQTMQKAVRAANAWGADLYIPIHTNAASSSKTRYFMMMTLNKSAAKYKKLANTIGKTIQAQYAAALKAAGYTAEAMVWSARSDLYELNTPQAISCYLEMGFHTNKTVDCTHFIHKDNGAYAGKAIAKGVCAYYGIVFKDPDETSVAPEPETPVEPEEKPDDPSQNGSDLPSGEQDTPPEQGSGEGDEAGNSDGSAGSSDSSNTQQGNILYPFLIGESVYAKKDVVLYCNFEESGGETQILPQYTRMIVKGYEKSRTQGTFMELESPVLSIQYRCRWTNEFDQFTNVFAALFLLGESACVCDTQQTTQHNALQGTCFQPKALLCACGLLGVVAALLCILL